MSEPRLRTRRTTRHLAAGTTAALALERVGNGLDEDCAEDTPDAPPGGISGSVLSWGGSAGVGLPPRSPADQPFYAPVPVTGLGDTVRALESSDRSGYAVLTDGTVRSWGLNFSGRLGDGTQQQRWEPATVLNVSGHAGSALTGVTSIAADSTVTIALRSNGSVVAWGSNTTTWSVTAAT